MIICLKCGMKHNWPFYLDEDTPADQMLLDVDEEKTEIKVDGETLRWAFICKNQKGERVCDRRMMSGVRMTTLNLDDMSQTQQSLPPFSASGN